MYNRATSTTAQNVDRLRRQRSTWHNAWSCLQELDGVLTGHYGKTWNNVKGFAVGVIIIAFGTVNL